MKFKINDLVKYNGNYVQWNGRLGYVIATKENPKNSPEFYIAENDSLPSENFDYTIKFKLNGNIIFSHNVLESEI
jgi:hypothetical protein